MLTEEFFNKSRFTIIKLSDQVEVKPNTLFTLATVISNTTSILPTTATAILVKTTGRDSVNLSTVVTVVATGNLYTFSATPAILDWDGTTSLTLKVTINTTDTVIVPLVDKG